MTERIHLESSVDVAVLRDRLKNGIMSTTALAQWSIVRTFSSAMAAERPLYGSVSDSKVLLVAARSFGNPLRVVFRGRMSEGPTGSVIDGRLARSRIVVLLLLMWIGYFASEVVAAWTVERMDLVLVFAFAVVFFGAILGASYVRSRGDADIIVSALGAALVDHRDEDRRNEDRDGPS